MSAPAEQRGAVEEFFELFKTPWEFYREGKTYDVVISATDAVPQASARLVVVFGSDIRSGDDGVSIAGRQRGGLLSDPGGQLPIYGDLLTFDAGGSGSLFLETERGFAGVKSGRPERPVVRRLGYDLFREVEHLLADGQPLERAHIPTLDIHIALLRNWILDAGISILEIPPAPAGHSFAVCLTHDIDFGGIRHHFFNHTMWGFLHRSTIGATGKLLTGKLPPARLWRTWRAILSLPFVYLGWAKDFWDPFGWYRSVEQGLPATYFMIPFKGRVGERVSAPNASRRAAAYELADLRDQITGLASTGCEVAVHGIDAWHSIEKGIEEREKVGTVASQPADGVRMHWLLRETATAATLAAAGYRYDSSLGYNETIGYRNGTTQVFGLPQAETLLELPLHIQDGALFYPTRLNLSDAEARDRCRPLIEHAQRCGGVLTVLWHDRSPGPERFWGDFYVDLVRTLQSLDAWFGTAGQVTAWFSDRRRVRFGRPGCVESVVRVSSQSARQIHPPVSIRIHRAGGTPVDIEWDGNAAMDIHLDEIGLYSRPDAVRV